MKIIELYRQNMYSDRDKLRAAPIKDILEVIRKSDASKATKEVTKKVALYYFFITLSLYYTA